MTDISNIIVRTVFETGKQRAHPLLLKGLRSLERQGTVGQGGERKEKHSLRFSVGK